MHNAIPVFSVEFDGVQWILGSLDGLFSLRTFVNRNDAMWNARKRAEDYRPSILRVIRQDGSLEAEFAYR